MSLHYISSICSFEFSYLWITMCVLGCLLSYRTTYQHHVSVGYPKNINTLVLEDVTCGHVL